MKKFSAGLATWRLFQVYDTRLKTVVRAIDGAGIGCTCPCGISIDGKFWGSKGNRCGEGSLVRWDEREGEKARQQNPRPANKQGRKARRAFHLVDFCFLPAALPTARFPPGRNDGLPSTNGDSCIHKISITCGYLNETGYQLDTQTGIKL